MIIHMRLITDFAHHRIKEEAYADIQFPNLDDTDEDPEQLLQLDGE